MTAYAAAIALGSAGLILLALKLHHRPPAASVLPVQVAQASATPQPQLRREQPKSCRMPAEQAPRTRQRKTALVRAT